MATFSIGAAICTAAAAHDYHAGDVRVVHPYATPSMADADSGAAYLATLENTGPKADRLMRVSTPLAARVELRSMSADDEGVMRMRVVADVALAPRSLLKMRPGQGLRFVLSELKQPLQEDQTFPMTLEFQRGGKVDLKAVVQIPRARPGEPPAHKH